VNPTTRQELRERVGNIEQRQRELNEKYGDGKFPRAVQDEWNRLVVERDEREDTLKELETRANYLATSTTGEERITDPDVERRYSGRRTLSRDAEPVVSDALRTLDRHDQERDGFFEGRSGELLEGHLRGTRGTEVGSSTGRRLDARYVVATGRDAYREAFAKVLADPQRGSQTWTAEEADAVTRVQEIVSERAGVAGGTGSAGGFALPIGLDPSIRLSSSGALSPIRELADVRSITTREWRAVTSTGGTATYRPEWGTVTDSPPVLEQPIIVPQHWDSFVGYSMELAGDWNAIESELLRVIADARRERRQCVPDGISGK
jgi:HK97 family phage major capsid protein